MSFPDAERLVIDYLEPIVSPVLVTIRTPSPIPSKLVTVRRFGGTQVTAMDRPHLDVFSWGSTEAEVEALCSQVRTAIHQLGQSNTLGVPCYQVNEILGPTWADDLESGKRRKWFSVQLVLRADV